MIATLIIYINCIKDFVQTKNEIKETKSLPIESKRAIAIARRVYVQSTRASKGSDRLINYYYVTFEFENGVRDEFNLDMDQYDMITEGDIGQLKIQGDWYVGFEKEVQEAIYVS